LFMSPGTNPPPCFIAVHRSTPWFVYVARHKPTHPLLHCCTSFNTMVCLCRQAQTHPLASLLYIVQHHCLFMSPGKMLTTKIIKMVVVFLLFPQVSTYPFSSVTTLPSLCTTHWCAIFATTVWTAVTRRFVTIVFAQRTLDFHILQGNSYGQKPGWL
jgi:hypothetical protein